jgi:NADP-dependent 3-hydroxy acid dehydrogenase YdfG
MLREEGFELTLVARREETLVAAAEELGAEAVTANVVSAEDCARAVAAHAERWGGMDVLVNSAGVGVGGTFADQETKHIDLQLDVNVRGTMLVTRESLPMLRASRGLVVNLASISGTTPVPGLAVYGASKAAVISFTSTLAREEAVHGVRTTAICPAFVATRMTEWTGISPDELIQPEDIAELVRALLRLGSRARVPQIVIERVGDAV